MQVIQVIMQAIGKNGYGGPFLLPVATGNIVLVGLAPPGQGSRQTARAATSALLFGVR